MRYYVTLDPSAEPTAIDVDQLPTGQTEVRINGRVVDVDVATVGHVLSVRVGGRMVDLTTEGAPPDVGVIASGRRAYVRVESERMRAASAARGGASTGGEKVLRSPMPGRVVKVLVEKGQEVKPGQSLVVVEAMKMENEVRAKTAGIVAEVHVRAGETVEGKAKLVSLA